MRVYGFNIFLLIVYPICAVKGKQTMEEVSTNNGISESCLAVRNEINAHKSYTMCMPRMVLVKLNGETNYTYYPNVVAVKRCDGSCHSPYSCMAVATNITSVVVKRVDNVSDRPKTMCHRVFVEEHTECKCLCGVMPQHCNSKQIYSESDCTCKCINMDEKQKCDAMPHRRWDFETCSCVCDLPKQECSTGLDWIVEYCGCMKVMSVTNTPFINNHL